MLVSVSSTHSNKFCHNFFIKKKYSILTFKIFHLNLTTLNIIIRPNRCWNQFILLCETFINDNNIIIWICLGCPNITLFKKIGRLNLSAVLWCTYENSNEITFNLIFVKILIFSQKVNLNTYLLNPLWMVTLQLLVKYIVFPTHM